MKGSGGRIRGEVVKVAVVALMAAGLAGFGNSAPALGEPGTSPTTYNCYTQWWNTAWAQSCKSGGAAKKGYYKSEVDCSGVDSGRSLVKWREKGDTKTHKGKDCVFGITNGWIWWSLPGS